MKGLILLFITLLCHVTCQIEVISNCTNGFQLSFFETFTTFDESQEICHEINASLVSIPDESTFQQVQSFMFENSLRFRMWVGLKREDASDPLDPSSFTFIDNSSFIGNFAQFRGQEPWDFDVPGDLAATVVESCVEFNSVFPFLWNDFPCTEKLATLCKTECTEDLEDEVKEQQESAKINILKVVVGIMMIFCFLLLLTSIISLHNATKTLIHQDDRFILSFYKS